MHSACLAKIRSLNCPLHDGHGGHMNDLPVISHGNDKRRGMAETQRNFFHFIRKDPMRDSVASFVGCAVFQAVFLYKYFCKNMAWGFAQTAKIVYDRRIKQIFRFLKNLQKPRCRILIRYKGSVLHHAVSNGGYDGE